MGEKHGAQQQAGNHQALGLQLPANPGEFHSVWYACTTGKRGGGAWPDSGPDSSEADLPTTGSGLHPAGRQCDWVLQGLQAVHHHQLQEPPLSARDLRQGGWGTEWETQCFVPRKVIIGSINMVIYKYVLKKDCFEQVLLYTCIIYNMCLHRFTVKI